MSLQSTEYRAIKNTNPRRRQFSQPRDRGYPHGRDYSHSRSRDCIVRRLGDQNDPTPSSDTDYSDNQLTFTKDGGSDFAIDSAEVQFEVTVEDPANGTSDTTEETHNIDADGQATTLTDVGGDLYYNSSLSDQEVLAGDTFGIGFGGGVPGGAEITEWSVDVVYAPDRQDSEIIYSAES